MRLLEIVIPFLLAAYLAWPHPRPRQVRYLPSAVTFLILLHLDFEGYRWQMIPLYVLGGMLTLSSLIKINNKSDWPGSASYLTLILLAASAALPALLPVPSITKPPQSMEVGTVIFALTDPSRGELYSGRDEARSFVVQVWYPADPVKGNQRASWMSRSDIYSPAISEFLELPSFFLDHLALAKTPAYIDAPLAETNTPFPVILFSHGWNGFNAQNSGQMILLASQGYVVASVNHTYGAIATAFPDGRIAYNNPNALPDGAPDDEYEVAARKLVDQWSGDLKYTLDQLAEKNALDGDPFFNKLDLHKVGVYGHSTGGGAAIQFCGTDERCTALLGMDPFMRPVSEEVLKNGVSQPSFFMFSQEWADLKGSRNNQLFDGFTANTPNTLGAVSIDGTRHHDFSDLPLLSPIAPQLGLKGPLNGKRVTEIVDAYLLEFFNNTIMNQKSDLFNSDFTDFEEVRPR